MDKLTPEKRSWNMSQIKSKNTKPEQIVASFLRENHVGYRRNFKNLPGKPDFVLSKYNAVIFVNGCFWHRHEGCKNSTLPKTNTEFWETKLQSNVDRDLNQYRELQLLGWRVFVIWECELEKNPKYHLQTLLKGILMDEIYD